MRAMQGRVLAAALILAIATFTQIHNPATGDLQYNKLSPADEKQLGREEHPKALAEFGGQYQDPTAQAYVTRVGNRVKNASELKDQSFTFTLLDSDVVNAFALPGGYVYVTRGLLALTNNEAELAGVLGHEVGHVTARHTAQRYDRAKAGELGATAAQLAGAVLGGLLGGSEGAQMGGQLAGQAGSLGAQAYVQGYSREQEFQADQLGVRYLAAAGYDPDAMATFLATLEAEDAYEQRQAGRGDDDSFLGDWFRSHPRTPERVQRAAEAAGAAVPSARATDRQALLAALDGLLYGQDPAQGVVDGASFKHPDLRIAFTAPPGFKLQNSPDAVVGSNGRGQVMRFDMAPKAGSGDLVVYLQNGWVTSQRLQNLQTIDVAGQPGAVGFGRVSIGGQAAAAMFAALRGQDGRVYRFVYADTNGLDRGDVATFEQSLRSFRPLAAAEAAQLRPWRLKLATVRAGDTVDSLAQQMQYDRDPRALFVLLNGLDRGRTLQPGDRVKLVVRG